MMGNVAEAVLRLAERKDGESIATARKSLDDDLRVSADNRSYRIPPKDMEINLQHRQVNPGLRGQGGSDFKSQAPPLRAPRVDLVKRLVIWRQ